MSFMLKGDSSQIIKDKKKCVLRLLKSTIKY